ncbi:MAG TPA: prepilin-type N-terminal cleavage/methylation domain-containing protein [Candidatus Limnocylindria bacterium]|nr:prepilin-type N-terminal cleavage/methylation domain-containing protein [Candidatus Limnocylindria bacterium]
MPLQSKINKYSIGFTLIELLVVISIIALLASVVLIALNDSRIKARDAKRKADILQLRKAIETYYQDNSIYPDDGSTPNNESDIQTLASVLVPKYLNKLPNDPKNSPKNYEYVYGNTNGTRQDYGILVPFANDGGQSCAWRTAGGSANWWKVGPTTMPDCSYQK